MSPGRKAKASGEDAGRAVETEATAQRIFVRDLQMSCRIGVTKAERRNRQRLAINLDLEVQPRVVVHDRITEVVDYTNLIEDMRRICLESEVRLLESLAERLVTACFLHKRVSCVRVRVEKLDLVPEAAGVGVEIERRRKTAS